MKKLCFAILAGLVILAAVAPATAQNRPYYAAAIGTGNQMANGAVYVRYYVPGYSTVSPSGSTATCPTSATGATVSWNNTLRACALRYLNAGGYKGYEDNIFKDALGNGVVHYGLMDLQTGAGTAGHIGYYFWDGRAVSQTGDPNSIFSGANCAGTAASTCLGQGNTTSSTGYALSNTPLGPINPLGGLRPIPVPKVVSVTKDADPGTDATISMNWGLDVKGWTLELTEFGPAKYQVMGLAKAVVGNACVPPTDAEFDTPLAGDVNHLYGSATALTGLTLDAKVSDFGKTKNDNFCYYFALRPVYDDTFSPWITSLYWSANSTGVVFGGLASSITNASAVITKGKVVTVTWKTTLSECMQGYNVLRSFSQTGPFIKVNRTLIPDRHGPASYSYIDVLKTPEKNLWYQVEGIGCDQSVDKTQPFQALKK